MNEKGEKEKWFLLMTRDKWPSVAISHYTSPVHEGEEKEEEKARHLRRQENITRLWKKEDNVKLERCNWPGAERGSWHRWGRGEFREGGRAGGEVLLASQQQLICFLTNNQICCAMFKCISFMTNLISHNVHCRYLQVSHNLWKRWNITNKTKSQREQRFFGQCPNWNIFGETPPISVIMKYMNDPFQQSSWSDYLQQMNLVWFHNNT